MQETTFREVKVVSKMDALKDSTFSEGNDCAQLQRNGHVKESAIKKVPIFPSARWTFSLMYFTGCITIYLMRANLSVAIVCMNTDRQDNVSRLDVNTLQNHTQDDIYTPQNSMGEFQWSRKLRGLILSSFAIGYIIGQSPCGWLTTKLGGKWLLFTGVGVMTLVEFVSPVTARASPFALVALEIVKGLACSTFYTSASCVIGYWTPIEERNKLFVLAMSGSLFGTIISFPLSGYLCERGFAGGWPSVFYVPGMISIFWMAAWACLVFDTPDKHPRISAAERDYINRSVPRQLSKTHRVPWKGMLTSTAFWAIFIIDYAYAWGFYTILASLPQYMQDMFQFSIKENGLLSAIPYVACWVVSLLFAALADRLITLGTCRVIVVRKIAMGLGFLIPAVLLIVAGFLRTSQSVLGVTVMASIMGAYGIARSGHYPNILDIAPRYAGLIMGISNSNLSGFLAPFINGLLTPTGSRSEWQHVFIVAAAWFSAGVVIYSVFARGTVQPWALGPETETEIDKEQHDKKMSKDDKNGYATDSGIKLIAGGEPATGV